MNILKAGQFFRIAGRLAVLFAVLISASGVRAQDKPQASRFLLIFETSPVLKKNLPAIQGTLAKMFSSNLQNEIRFDDDIAVWTVDEKLHTGTFPLENWSPADAAEYTEKLNDFIVHQKFNRHASLAALQPLLNRVVKGSARLTVLIFCDSESELIGTPYDSGVNEIITNAAARLKGAQVPFILVLRSYQGEYLGCSVNRSEPLNFPKFPAPPKPAPAPAPAPVVIKPAPAPVVAPVTGPVVTPVQSLIVIGTNLSTNASILLKPANASTTTPAPPLVMNPPPVNTPPPAPAPIIVTAPQNPTPVPTPPVTVQPQPTPAPAPQKTYTPEPSVVSTPPTATPATPTQPQSTSPSSSAPLAAATTPADAGYLWPMLLGGGLLVAAIGIIIWFMTRSRHPQGSLITSSMQDDPRLPPRK